MTIDATTLDLFPFEIAIAIAFGFSVAVFGGVGGSAIGASSSDRVRRLSDSGTSTVSPGTSDRVRAPGGSREPGQQPSACNSACPPTSGPLQNHLPPHHPALSAWARLIARVYEVDPLRCRRCGGNMQLIAFITERVVIVRILDHLGELNKHSATHGADRRPSWP